MCKTRSKWTEPSRNESNKTPETPGTLLNWLNKWQGFKFPEKILGKVEIVSAQTVSLLAAAPARP
jgi:hypothetical protein